MKKGGEILLRSGALFNPLSPDPSLITIEDIAYGLSGQFRFSGHSRYTVAQHCVLGSEYLREGPFSLPFLLHDADEGLGLPDIARPVKYDPRFAFYRKAGEVLHRAIEKRFGVDLSSPEIKFVDTALGNTEKVQLMGNKEYNGEDFLPIKIEVWSPDRAEQEFLQRFYLLSSPQKFTTGQYAKIIGLHRSAALGRLQKLEERGIVERCLVFQNQGGVIRKNVVGWRFVQTGNSVIGTNLSDKSGRSSGDTEDDSSVVEGFATSSSGIGRGTVVRSRARGSERAEVSGEEVDQYMQSGLTAGL